MKDPVEWLSILAQHLPQNASFFIIYVTICWCLPFLELLQLPSVFSQYMASIYPGTPRAKAMSLKPQRPLYHLILANDMLVFTISIVYAVLCPIIVPFTMIYFCLNYVAYKYQILYVYVPIYEIGSKYAPLLRDQMLNALMLSQTTLIAVLYLKKSQAACLALVPLLLGTLCFRFYCSKLAQKNNSSSSDDPNAERMRSLRKLSELPEKRPKVEDLDPESDSHEIARFYYNEDYTVDYQDQCFKQSLSDPWLNGNLTILKTRSIDWASLGRILVQRRLSADRASGSSLDHLV